MLMWVGIFGLYLKYGGFYWEIVVVFQLDGEVGLVVGVF